MRELCGKMKGVKSMGNMRGKVLDGGRCNV
jgi:hypothetical protein